MLFLKVIELLIYMLLIVVAVGAVAGALSMCCDLFLKAKERKHSDQEN